MCLYLTKNKQTEIIHKNSENLNQMKLMFRLALGNGAIVGALSEGR